MVDGYVYALVDPRDDEIRYVGITTQPRSRYLGHICEARNNTRTRKRQWIRSLMKQGLEPTFAVLDSGNMTRAQLCALEIAYIARLTFEGHDLTNMTEGGDGLNGFAAARTPQWGDNLREAIAKHMASLTPEQKAARSAKRVATIIERNGGTHPGYTEGRTSPMKGRTMSEETKQKMRDAHRKRWAKIKEEGRYEEVCANIAAGTKLAMNQETT